MIDCTLVSTKCVVEMTGNPQFCYFRIENFLPRYAYTFCILEVLNLANVFLQFIITDKFLHGKFLDYGSRLLEYHKYYDVAWDPMDEVFPKIAKCQFNRHGPGGGIQNHDALCLLPLNIVNEKIYLFMWIWLIVLGVASGLTVIYRLVCISVPEVRILVLWKSFNKWSDVAKVCKKRPYGDWFLLRQMAKNVEPDVFDEFLKELSNNDDFKKHKVPEVAHIAFQTSYLSLLYSMHHHQFVVISFIVFIYLGVCFNIR